MFWYDPHKNTGTISVFYKKFFVTNHHLFLSNNNKIMVLLKKVKIWYFSDIIFPHCIWELTGKKQLYKCNKLYDPWMNLMAIVETVALVGNDKKRQRSSSEGLLFFAKVLSLKTLSNLLSTMLAFHLEILKKIRPFVSSHSWMFVLKSSPTQLKPCFSLSANNTATNLRYFEKGLLK